MMVAIFGLVGAVAAGIAAYSTFDFYESSGTLRLARVNRPADQEARRLRMEAAAANARGEAVSVHVVWESDAVFTVSAAHKDRHRAQKMTGDLLMAIARAEARAGAEEDVEVIEPSLPYMRGGSRPATAAGAGFGGGALLWMIVAPLVRRVWLSRA